MREMLMQRVWVNRKPENIYEIQVKKMNHKLICTNKNKLKSNFSRQIATVRRARSRRNINRIAYGFVRNRENYAGLQINRKKRGVIFIFRDQISMV